MFDPPNTPVSGKTHSSSCRTESLRCLRGLTERITRTPRRRDLSNACSTRRLLLGLFVDRAGATLRVNNLTIQRVTARTDRSA